MSVSCKCVFIIVLFRYYTKISAPAISQFWVKYSERQNIVDNKIQWKTNTVKDKIQWKTKYSGRQNTLEDKIQWKTIYSERRNTAKDTIQWQTRYTGYNGNSTSGCWVIVSNARQSCLMVSRAVLTQHSANPLLHYFIHCTAEKCISTQYTSQAGCPFSFNTLPSRVYYCMYWNIALQLRWCCS